MHALWHAAMALVWCARTTHVYAVYMVRLSHQRQLCLTPKIG